MKKLTHIDGKGNAVMVDVRKKKNTHRIAVAKGSIKMQKETCQLIATSSIKKGDVIATARIAGIMASKKTSDLIPLCHSLYITRVAVDFEIDEHNGLLHCLATVETEGKTGVEIEALNAVQISLLTIYDMCKAIDRGMLIIEVGLQQKSGGKSGLWERQN